MNNRMTKPMTMNRARQRGMTLMEAIVATAIFTVVFLTALALYQVANRTYLSTDAATIQQQNMRFAMDRVSETLRDAGANYNTLGAKNLADEQIEGGWEAAVFVRGDFDNARESDLEDPAVHAYVSTGNDEIVGYILRKNGAAVSGRSVTVKLDLSDNRDAIYTSDSSITNEESKTIPVAATTLAEQTDPPYELTKVTFKSDGTPKYEVVAENVFRMSFKYFDEDNKVLAAFPAGADAERDERRTIRRIAIDLIGMADRPDGDYVDPTTYTPVESASTKHYRKFSLSQSILSSNLGITGRRHLTVPALSLVAPASITTCAGHCRNYLVKWPAVTGVTAYEVRVTAPASSPAPAFDQPYVVSSTEFEFTEPAVDITNALTRTFTFKVAATAAGVVGTYTPTVSLVSNNDSASVPSDVTGVTAEKAPASNAMAVTWTAVTTNTGNVTTSTCQSAGSVTGPSAPPSPWNGKAVDLTNYKVYRVRSDGTTTGSDATTDISNANLGALQNVPTAGVTFLDNLAAPCTPYFYRVKACDLCAVESLAYSAPMSPAAKFTIADGIDPAQPGVPTPVGTVDYDGAWYRVMLTWPPVVRTDTGEPAAVSHYAVKRFRRLEGDSWTAPPSLPESAGGATIHVYDTTTSPMDVIPAQVTGRTAYYRYYIQAIYDCATPRESIDSVPYDLACTPPPSNTVTITTPAAGRTFSRPLETSATIQMTTTGTGWTAGSVQVKDAAGTVVYTNAGTLGSGVINFPAWDVSSLPDGAYTITGTATVGACQAIAAPRTVILETATCGLRFNEPVTWNGSGVNSNSGMNFTITNTCDDVDLTLNAFTPTWTNTPGTLRISNITNAAITLYNNATGSASGVRINFLSNVALTRGATSSTFTFTFVDPGGDGRGQFTNDGSRDGTPATTRGSFTSILGHTTTGTADETIDSPPVP